MLQGQLVGEQNARKEERFLWFVGCGLLLIIISFQDAGVAGGSVVSLVYLALILVLSRKWGFEELWEALYAARDLLRGKRSNGDDEV
jgi:hypothetical protein